MISHVIRQEIIMITTLTILSLDQGKIYRPDPVAADDVDLDAIAARHISRIGTPSIGARSVSGRFFPVSGGSLGRIGGLMLRLWVRRQPFGEVGS
jgi:hypothetical protein